jgi:thioester reductase-like protein
MGRTQGAGVVPALFVTEYALARQLMAWGVQPIGMIGHSLGEYVAACLAGVFPLSGALELTLARGELFAAMAPGRMLVVALPEQALTPRLPERISVSAVNAPDLTVVAGPDEDIAGLLSTLRADGVDCRPVGVPVASHSWMVEPFLAEFLVRVKAVPLSPPRIPFISGVSGTWITDEQATDPRYWAAHLRRPVRFADGVREVFARPGRVLVEVGPGRALSSLTTAQRLAPTPVAVPTMGLPRDSLPDLAHLVGAVGKLWQTGVPVDWQAFHGDARPARVPLPGYPFQRSRHWIAAGRRVDRSTSDESVLDGSAVSAGPTGGPARDGDQDRDRDRDRPGGPRTDRERQVARIWCDLLGVDEVGIDEDFFELGAHSLMVTQVTKELRRMGATTLTARDVLAASTVADMAALVDTALGVVATAPRGPALDLAAEVVLPEEIAGTGSAPAYDGPARTVLLTGATGFVGAFLCAELLASTKATVLCLVRAADEADALERLRTRLEHYGLPAGPARRLRVVVGDLAAPLLGLPEHRFDELAGQLDAIYHCGAWVNFVRPYRALKAANVLGTQEVLRLACRGRLTPVHYISTLAVLAGSMGGDTERILESDPLPPPVGHDTAYSQSKWVAEGLIGIARRRGIPVSVYRAGGVLPDSRTGATNTEDYVTKVIQGCVQLGLAPRRQYALSVGTVDHLARLVVSLASRPPAGPPGVGSAGVGGTFHTIDPRPLAWNEIFVQIRRFGYPVRSVPFDDWRSRLIEQVDADGEDNALAPLMAMIGETPDRRMPVIDCSAVAAALPPDGCAAPELDEGFFGRMLGFFVRGRLLPPIPVPASGE